jgi:hypothetical protein
MVAGGRSEARQGLVGWLVGLERTWFAMSLFLSAGREGVAMVVLMALVVCTSVPCLFCV